MNDQFKDAPEEGVDPPRLKFYEEVQVTFQKTVESLCRNVPEFLGATITLVWDMETSRDLPHGLILGKKVESPVFTLRAAEQTNKTLQNLTKNFLNQLVQGDQAVQELDRKIAVSQQELHELEKKIQERSEELARISANNPGPG